jgi:mannose-6-phosphate isomerase class I
VSASRYDKYPTVRVSTDSGDLSEGWAEILPLLDARVREREGVVVAVECYPGVDVPQLRRALVAGLAPDVVVDAEDALLPSRALATVLAPYLGDDPVFGYLCPLELDSLFQPDTVELLRRQATAHTKGVLLVIGTGATLVAPNADLLVYADLTRWEVQQRQRRHELGNLGADNAGASPAALYKRAFFVDWRIADRHRTQLFERIDYYLDANVADVPRLVRGDLFRGALQSLSVRPFRLVPFFDPGPWGGEWMRRRFDLPDEPENFAWCFDCVPEENSLLFGFGSRRLHAPALPLVHQHPEQLLGQHVHASFGAEFPIRFDLLDTMDGGNLSLQVHPLRDYIRERFGMSYTQDESYYLLDAKPGAVVYLGLTERSSPARFERDLRAAQNGGPPFPVAEHVNAWPARKHDHFSIPAGTVHCSGKDTVVLEISATPYIFTFKLWDWERLGLDGKARPIHLEHGLANIQWDRTSDWVRQNLINRMLPLGRGESWPEESTGLHPLEFIETRRHWSAGPVEHDTAGTLNVLNLVEGEEAIVESPTDAFDPLLVHHAETFVVPAAVGAYRVRPAQIGAPSPLATIKAYVRAGGT